MKFSRVYATAAAGFLVFAVWGSLFPFVFRPIPIEVAIGWFLATWQTETINLSLTDLVSNVLLFVPIGLFLVAALEHRHGGSEPVEGGHPEPVDGRAGIAAAVVAAGAALSIALEIGQAFVPGRTTSILDVVAETVGVAAGIALWRTASTEFDSLLRRAWNVVERSTPLQRALIAYGITFAVLWLLPFDFTIRPAEIGDKYAHGRLLLPFTVAIDAATPRKLAVVLASAVPLGVGAVLIGGGVIARRSVAHAAIVAAVALLALEVVQVFVFSRNTDTTELLAAVVGATGGSVAAARSTHRHHVWPLSHRLRGAVMPVAAWAVTALILEWWPFHVGLDPGRARVETEAWARAPFRVPHGTFDMLAGVLLAFAAGIWMGGRLSREFARLQALVAVMACGAVFLTFEVGRLLLINGRPTLVGPLVKVAAVLAGIVFATRPTVPLREGARSAD